MLFRSYSAIERMFPPDEWHRVLVASDRWTQLVDDSSPFDERIHIEPHKFAVDPRYRYPLMRRIRAFRAAKAINCRLTRTYVWDDSVIRVSRANERISAAGRDNLMTRFQERVSERWYTRLMPEAPRGEHEIVSLEKYFAALSPGIDVSPRMPTRVSDRSAKAIFFAGATDPGRRWPIESLAEAMRHAHDRHGLTPVLCGGPGEGIPMDRLSELVSFPIEDLVGKLTLRELETHIASASLVVSNDTGAGHMATVAEIGRAHV